MASAPLYKGTGYRQGVPWKMDLKVVPLSPEPAAHDGASLEWATHFIVVRKLYHQVNRSVLVNGRRLGGFNVDSRVERRFRVSGSLIAFAVDAMLRFLFETATSRRLTGQAHVFFHLLGDWW